MKIPVKYGTSDKSLQIKVKDTSGNGVTDLVASDFTASYFITGGSAEVSITLSDLTALDDSYSEGGVFEIGNGKYRFDVPDLMFAR